MIDRKTYLEMCQKVSVLERGVLGTKKDVPRELLVSYNKIEFYPEKYLLSFEKGQAIHTAVLHGINANYVVNVPLEMVEKVES